MQKKKEVFEIPRQIEVDGVTSTLVVKVDFTRVKNGHVKITTGLTTKQLSFNDAVQEAVFEQLVNMLRVACKKGNDLITELYEESTRSKVDRSQLTINDLLNGEEFEVGQPAADLGDGGPDDEAEMEPAPAAKSKRGRPRKKAQQEEGKVDVPIT